MIRTAYTQTEVTELLRSSKKLLAALGPPCKRTGTVSLYNPGRVDRFLDLHKDRLAPSVPSEEKEQKAALIRAKQKERWAKIHAEARDAANAADIKIIKGRTPLPSAEEMKATLDKWKWEPPYFGLLRNLRHAHTNYQDIAEKQGVFSKSREARFILMNRANKIICDATGLPFTEMDPEKDDIPPGKHQRPLSEKDVVLLGLEPKSSRSIYWYKEGRFGPYVSDVRTSASVPHYETNDVTLEKAVLWLEQRSGYPFCIPEEEAAVYARLNEQRDKTHAGRKAQWQARWSPPPATRVPSFPQNLTFPAEPIRPPDAWEDVWGAPKLKPKKSPWGKR